MPESRTILYRGARPFKCALQVNPFAYVCRHPKPGGQFPDEGSYNAAMVQAMVEQGVNAIAITDHGRLDSTEGLAQLARMFGINVFPGFEIESNEGVHVLCLFPEEMTPAHVNRLLGHCGMTTPDPEVAISNLDFETLIKRVQAEGGLCVAAHVTHEKGLLIRMNGQAGANRWTSPDLLAAAIPGDPADTGLAQNLRQILLNRNEAYRRDRMLALINAGDVSSPTDLAQPGATTWITMAAPTLEGLHQAFLDPELRIRRGALALPDHDALVSVEWQGGFLDGQAIALSNHLNVLIGGRGAGKSTVLESVRYALNLTPMGDEAKKAHHSMVQGVLKGGTEVRLRVHSAKPHAADYWIVRTVGNPPVVLDAAENRSELTPQDVFPHVDLFGQHELAELAKSPEKMTQLLRRFVREDGDGSRQKAELLHQMELNRRRIRDTRSDYDRLMDDLGKLPAQEEAAKRFEAVGLKERLKDKTGLIREQRVIGETGERLSELRQLLNSLQDALPIDRAYLSPVALEGMAGKPILAKADGVFERLSGELTRLAGEMAATFEIAEGELLQVRTVWDARKQAVETEYEAILRQLQQDKIDGTRYVAILQELERLRPVRQRADLLAASLRELEAERWRLLDDWWQRQAEELRQLHATAKRLSRHLRGKVKVSVQEGPPVDQVTELLAKELERRGLADAIGRWARTEQPTVAALVNTMRNGAEALQAAYSLTAHQAGQMASASESLRMEIEELEPIVSTRAELNLGSEAEPEWRSLENLSTGQKATALLLLLLQEAQGPLFVDQPEDDLDNRFIVDGVVPLIREIKPVRQLVFASHNANLPVLGDAELIVGLKPEGEDRACISPELSGPLEARKVGDLVKETLEGGQAAFETRRRKYGF